MRSTKTAATALGLAALLWLLGPAPAAAQTGQPAKPAGAAAQPAKPSADQILAAVNGAPSRMSDIQDAAENLPDQYRSIPVERLMAVLLNQLISNKLLLAEGKRQKLGEAPEVAKRVESFRDRAIQQVLLENVVHKSVTDDALQTLYKKYLADNPPKEEVSARHILVESEADAKGIIAQLRSGADFASLAKQKSKDPAAQNGGDLGFFGKDEMVKEFADAAFTMKTGEISAAPVKTQFGWHVIKVEDRRSANPVTFDEARQDLFNQLSQQTVSQYIETLRNNAKIERFGPDGKPLPAEPPKKPN
ncbi:MAG: peptidylprolyl isomerase [Rhodospirillales bacterium]